MADDRRVTSLENVGVEDILAQMNKLQIGANEILRSLRAKVESVKEENGEVKKSIVAAPIDDNERERASQLIEQTFFYFQLFQRKMRSQIVGLEEEVNEIRERELEWKKLADLFAEYKEKMTEEVEGLRKIIREYKSSKMEMQEVLVKSESENRELRDSLNICKDVIIRMHANHRRRANLERIKKEIEDDENKIAQVLADLKFDNV